MTIAAVLLVLLVVLTAIHVAVMAAFHRGIGRLRSNVIRVPLEWPRVSVVVPARNEAEVLELTLSSLRKQDYPGEWEVVVVDDRSTDATPEILRNAAFEDSHVRVVTITTPFPISPKKNAIAKGVRSASGDIIVTTDADCSYHRSWLRSMVMHVNEATGVVAGLTVFDLQDSPVPLWQRIQWLDFFIQNFLAAGAVGLGVPSSCNGSNLLFRREAFDRISGYGEHATVVSGDDVLFAQRVARMTKWKIVYAVSAETVVRSIPVATLRELFHQRLRWASKGLTYRASMKLFLFAVYFYYLLLLAVPFAIYFNPELGRLFLLAIAAKVTADYLVVRQGSAAFGRTTPIRYFLAYEIVHTLFTPLFGLLGLLLPFRWKGDWYRTPRLPRAIRRPMVRFRWALRQRRPSKSAV